MNLWLIKLGRRQRRLSLKSHGLEVIKLETLKYIFEQVSSGTPYYVITHSINRTPSYTAILCSYFKESPYEDVIELLFYKRYQTYSLDEYIDIAEQLVTHNIKLIKGVVQFRISYNRLARLVMIRREKEAPLTYKDLESLGWTGRATVEAKPKQVKARSNSLPNIQVTPHSSVMTASDMSAEELAWLLISHVSLAEQTLSQEPFVAKSACVTRL